MHGRIFRAFPIGPFTVIPEGDPVTTGISAKADYSAAGIDLISHFVIIPHGKKQRS